MKELHGFELIKEVEVSEINSKVFLYRHIKTGTELMSIINNDEERIEYPPLIVLKENQVLLQITSRDFSFITEDNISVIYQIFHHQKIKINLIQNAAISLVVCVDFDESKLPALIEQLENDYKVLRNENMRLLTIRHYSDNTAKDIIKENEIILEQKTRTTHQIVY